APEGAAALVDRVLIEQRRTIEQADDPDPAVRDALRMAIQGAPRRARTAGIAPIAATALVVLLALAGVRYLGLTPETTPLVPSTYALDVQSATSTLNDAGYEVATRTVEVCETADLIIATVPAAGTPAVEGTSVTLLVAQPPGLSCPVGAGFRSQVWQFLRWVRGFGPLPPLAERPTVVTVDATGTRTVRVDRADITAQVAAGELLDVLRTTVTEVPDPTRGALELTVRNGIGLRPCGASPPTGYDSLLSIRFDLEPSEERSDSCPLTGYLIFAGDLIETIAVLSPTGSPR
ncbi:MAG: PASTA domain-containing protein, partial [Nocardioides sp.]